MQCVQPANILQASRKDVASIHKSLASCEYYNWSVLAASILHSRFVPKIRMRKYSMRTNVRLQYACCTFAACMLRTRSTQAASFFFCARHVRHFHKGNGDEADLTFVQTQKTQSLYSHSIPSGKIDLGQKNLAASTPAQAITG